MRGSKAKLIRKAVYGDLSFKDVEHRVKFHKKPMIDEGGQIKLDADGKPKTIIKPQVFLAGLKCVYKMKKHNRVNEAEILRRENLPEADFPYMPVPLKDRNLFALSREQYKTRKRRVV